MSFSLTKIKKILQIPSQGQWSSGYFYQKNFLVSHSPRTKLLIGDCFIAMMGAMVEITLLAIKCQKKYKKWQYSNNLAAKIRTGVPLKL